MQEAKKVAVIATHPIQYFAPWFQYLAKEESISINVYYLWDFGIVDRFDPGFRKSFKWDISLLDGYNYEFVKNVSRNAGTHHFWGLQNPSLLKQVRQFRPDAVLAFGYNYASLLQFIWRWDKKNAPLLFRGDSHRLVKRRGIQEWCKKKLISLNFTRFDGFLYVGKANREYFTYHGVPANRLFYAPHAVDNERFFAQSDMARKEATVWKKEIGISPHHAVILFAGKFDEKKRPADLIMAFLKADLKDTSLLIVGTGPLEGMLKNLANNHSNIYFAPFQNQSLMPRTYASGDIFVLPSYGHAETWGLAINEAMCMARPIIASSHVGCAQDLVRHGENGLVFPAGDVDALADCLRKAFSDRLRLKLWGEESRRIIADFNYANVTKALLDALNCLCVSRNHSR